MSVKTEPDDNPTQLPWEQPLVAMTTQKNNLPQQQPPLSLSLSGNNCDFFLLFQFIISFV